MHTSVVRVASALPLLLAGATMARAQANYFTRTFAETYDADKWAYRVDRDSAGAAVTSGVNDQYGQLAAASADATRGKLRGTAVTTQDVASTYASLRAEAYYALSFRQTAQAYVQPIEFYLDGIFTDSRSPGTSGYTGGGAGLSLAVYRRPNFEGAFGGRSISATYQNVPPSGQPQDLTPQLRGTFEFTVPGSATPGSLFTVFLLQTLSVGASNGVTADFSRTASLYVPTVAGHAWVSPDGMLAQQSRPAWATTTTTPEPATWTLLAVGLFAVAAAHRRVMPRSPGWPSHTAAPSLDS